MKPPVKKTLVISWADLGDGPPPPPFCSDDGTEVTFTAA